MKKRFPKFPKNPIFNSSDLLQPINMFASPMVSHLKSDWTILGTGVIIAPGFAITAKHLITALIEKYEGIQIDRPNNSIPQDIKGTHNTFLFQLFDKKYLRWTVNQCFLSPYTDVCFLSLSPLFNFKDYNIDQKISLALRQPKIGERVVGYGFPNSKVEAIQHEIRINVNPKTTVGEVIEIFPNGRDKMIPFPVFRTNARFDPGMSGGPVFNESGQLCGLVCSNMPPFNPELDHISYVTLLWPSMGTKVFLKLKAHDLKEKFPVLFLAKNKYIEAEDWEYVKILPNNHMIWEEPN